MGISARGQKTRMMGLPDCPLNDTIHCKGHSREGLCIDAANITANRVIFKVVRSFRGELLPLRRSTR